MQVNRMEMELTTVVVDVDLIWTMNVCTIMNEETLNGQ